MRNPPLATIRDLEGYQPRVDGEPPMALTSINRLSDMHEAMDIEDEMTSRAEDFARKKAQQGRNGQP
jgi:hypothetical protein